MSIDDFTTTGLKSAEFIGWIPLLSMVGASPPRAPGIYVVTYPPSPPERYAVRNCGGWFKGKDPSVAREHLVVNWVDGAEVVYIGQSDNLNRRLNDLSKFGAGKPVGHWGGRLIWQLANVAALIVAWRETPNTSPRDTEAEMIARFREIYGKPPFANAPHLLGR